MARGRRKRRTPKRSPRRTRILGKINRLPFMPPSLDIQSNVFTCWLRSETGVLVTDKQYWINEWTISEMLSAQYSHLLKTFAEYRLKRVNVWFIPSVTITATGIYAMAVYDDGDNYFVTPSLSDITAAPGSQTAKRYQPLRSAWHRTEPKDKNWLLMNTDSKPMSTAIATSAAVTDAKDPTISGVLILDIHIAFRGLKAASNPNRLRRYDVVTPTTSFESLHLCEQE